MSHITTYTGKRFDPTNPDSALIDIVDIAHALSYTCRGNGHVKSFYSVAQHCLACASEAKLRGYSVRAQLACLLHDASEAYLNDITRPVKAKLPTYKEIEAVLQGAIYKAYMGGCSEEELAAMKEIDDDMLSFELHHLLGETVDERYKSIKTPITFDLVPMDAVERRYREAFERLRSEI